MDLMDAANYAFSKFYPNQGGFRTIVATGETIKRSWMRALKRQRKHPEAGYDRFIAAFSKRPSNACKLDTEPIGRWREVVLYPRKDLYMMVQPVDRRHNAASLRRLA